MSPTLLIVANWKSYFSFKQAQAFFEQNGPELQKLTGPKLQLVLCPSFESLFLAQPWCKRSGISLGAQVCSSYAAGAHTGDVSALSLSQLGCRYAIVGHIERRTTYHESDKQLAQQILQLFDQNITPILCIGDTLKEYQEGSSINALEEQLLPILKILNQEGKIHKKILIAYEPFWAIGANKTAKSKDLDHVFASIDRFLAINGLINYGLLYGGGVNEAHAQELKKSNRLQGFLIGRASTDFQSLKKIVSCLIEHD